MFCSLNHRRSRHIHVILMLSHRSSEQGAARGNALRAGQDLYGLSVRFYKSNIFERTRHQKWLMTEFCERTSIPRGETDPSKGYRLG